MPSSDEDEKKKRSINEMFGGDDSDDSDDDQIRPESSLTSLWISLWQYDDAAAAAGDDDEAVPTSAPTADASGLFGSDSESEEEEDETSRKPMKKAARPPPAKRAKTSSSSSKKRHDRHADGPSRRSAGSGDEYDSGDEVLRTKDDDDFIDHDDDLEDVIGEYDQDEQKFHDDRPLPEQGSAMGGMGDGDKSADYFEETLKSLKTGRRAKMRLSVQEQEHIVQEVLYRMDKAHADDLASIAERRPALERIKYVDTAIRMLRKQQLQPTFLEFDLLSFITKWIQPLDDGTLPNLGVRTKMLQMVARLPVMKDQLKRSGLGKVVMMLWKHPEETRDNKDLCRDLIERWSRAVFDKTLDYSKLAELEAEKAENMGYRRPDRHALDTAQKRAAAAANRASGEANPFLGRGGSDPKNALTASERAIMPAQLKFDFMHRPQPKVDVSQAPEPKKLDADSRKVRLQKRMIEIARPGRKGKRSVSLSIEGR